MPNEKLFADLLQEYAQTKKTGALYVSVTAASENLIRFYFKDGNIYHISYGPLKDKECLDVLDCYDFSRAVFFTGLKASAASSDLPKTAEIIALVRKSGKKVLLD